MLNKKLLLITFFSLLAYSLFVVADVAEAKKWYDKAKAYTDEKKYEQALTTIKLAIEEEPTFPEAYFLLGEIYFKQKNKSEACKSYYKCIELIEATDDMTISLMTLKDKCMKKIAVVDKIAKEFNLESGKFNKKMETLLNKAKRADNKIMQKKILEYLLLKNPKNNKYLELYRLLTGVDYIAPAQRKKGQNKSKKDKGDKDEEEKDKDRVPTDNLKLFNGRDLSDWEELTEKGEWGVDDGCIYGTANFKDLAIILSGEGEMEGSSMVDMTMKIGSVASTCGVVLGYNSDEGSGYLLIIDGKGEASLMGLQLDLDEGTLKAGVLKQKRNVVIKDEDWNHFVVDIDDAKLLSLKINDKSVFKNVKLPFPAEGYFGLIVGDGIIKVKDIDMTLYE